MHLKIHPNFGNAFENLIKNVKIYFFNHVTTKLEFINKNYIWLYKLFIH